MIKCEICGKEFKNYRTLGIHVKRIHNLTTKQYYDTFIKKEYEGNCLQCGKKTKFEYLSTGYRRFCSAKCFSNNPLIKEKKKETILEKYGTEHYSQTNEVKNKKKETCLKKYGVENPSQLEEFKSKRKETMLEKYGVENAMLLEEFKDKIKQCWKDKTEDQKNDIVERKKETMLENYGVEHYSQTEEYSNKVKETSLKKYGVEHYSQTEECKKRKKETMLENYGVECSIHLSDKYYSKISQELFWNIYSKLPEELRKKCYFAELNKEFSIGEGNKYYFYDFTISSIKLCIEFNGDYWHKNPQIYNVTNENIDKWIYDRDKNNLLKRKGYKIITIWENEYNSNKNDIVLLMYRKIMDIFSNI